jgi:serine phosphatase RsbU (regulator of sigma subunit)
MTLGDVAGKGMPAALLVTKLTSEARYHFLSEPDVARAMSSLNNLLAPSCSRADRFVTLAAASLDLSTHVATLANAGHPSPLLYRAATNTVEECVPLKVSGLALGITDNYPFDSCQVKLEPGDALLMYSDGVPDAESPAGKSFTPQALLRSVRAMNTGSPQTLVDRLIKTVDLHMAGGRPFDDITLAALGRNA